MRIRHSIQTLVPLVVFLLTGLSAEAQYGAPYPSSGMTWYNGPPGYPPGAQMMPGQGGPPSFLPYPNMSPYDHLLDEHYNQNGLWFRNSVDGFGPFSHPRKYFLNVDYTRTRTRDLKGIVGDEDVQTYLQQQLQTPTTTPGAGAGAGAGGATGATTQMGFYNFFNAAQANQIPDLFSNGVKVSGGFWNADSTGLLFSANWNDDKTSVFDARAAIEAQRLPLATILELRQTGGRPSGAPFNLAGANDRQTVEDVILAPGSTFDTAGTLTHGVLGTTAQILDRSLFNLYGIPLANGPNNLPIGTTPSPGGVTVPYDMDFILTHSISNFGGSTDWAFNPIYERRSLTVRPVFGARYYRINEAFGFRGVDSGLSYGGTGAGGAGAGAGGGASGSFVANTKTFPPGDGLDQNGDFIADTPSEAGITTYTQVGPMIRSSLDSTARSDLAGPELGLHYQLGDDDGVRFSGSSKIGALYNRERLNLAGSNIANHMGRVNAAGTTEVTDIDRSGSAAATAQNTFADSETGSHISPMFEQGINAEIPIFSRVPVLKDLWQLEGASFNVGWNYLLITEVADPNQSIIWASRPTTGLKPQISAEREIFTQSTFNFGVNWVY